MSKISEPLALPKIEHKTQEFGASHDTDYKVITLCIPDCPACAAELTFRSLVADIQKHGKDVFTDEPGRFEDGHYWGLPIKYWQSLKDALEE